MNYRAGITRTGFAIALIVSATIGIGFLGIPYTFAQAGSGIGAVFLLGIAGVFLVTNLLYGEIILRTHGRHQFVGYVSMYLGRSAQKLSVFSYWIALYGSIIAIILINSSFLSQIFAIFGIVVSAKLLGIIFFAATVAIIYRGLKIISRIDILVFGAVVLIVVILVFSGLSKIDVNYFVFSEGHRWFLPFGVILFSLSGIQGIPLARELLVGKERSLKTAIKWGTLIPAFFYLFFSLVVVGVSGRLTSSEAIAGLQNSLGGWVTLAGALLGSLTSFTIFLSIGSAFKESLAEDFGYKKKGLFLLFIVPALIVFLTGAISFIGIINLVGGVSVGIDIILLLLVYAKARESGTRIPEYSMRIPNFVLCILLAVFFMAAIYTIMGL